MQIDILHFSSTRLAPLVWRECKALPVSMQDAQAVWLAKKLYVGGGFSVEENETDQHDQALYVYTPATDVWDIIATPVYWFALATYRSQLVLVGGDDKKCMYLT